MNKTIILFQPKLLPGKLLKEKPLSPNYYYGPRETFRYLPLSLLYLSAPIKNKYKIKIFDERYDENWKESVRQIISTDEVLCVGITAATGFEIYGGLGFAKYIRSLNKSIPIVWGGWHASTEPNGTIMSEYVDIIVRGQGENTFQELLECLDLKKEFSNIKGLTFLNNTGKIIHTADREIIPAKDLPQLDLSLIDVQRYLKYNDGTPARLFYISTIGCPYSCAFCSIASVYKKHWSAKTPQQVANELEYFVKNYGITSVEFDGTNFFANPKWVKNVFRQIINKNLKLNIVSSTRADTVTQWDDEMIKLLKRVGFIAIGIGAESGSQKILDSIEKKLSPEDIFNSVKILKNANIDTAYTFMFGLPGEDKHDVNLTIDLIKSIKKEWNYCRIAALFYHPFPGSKTYKQYKDFYKLPDYTLEKWAEYSSDLKYVSSLKLSKSYINNIRKRIKYIEWAYPRYKYSNILKKLLSLIASFRIRYDIYHLPLEWIIARILKRIKY